MKRGTKYVSIRGLRWKLILGRPPVNSCDGYCDLEKRSIWIRPQKDVNVRSTAIHEVLHAALPDVEEQAITETEVAIEAVLQLIEKE